MEPEDLPSPSELEEEEEEEAEAAEEEGAEAGNLEEDEVVMVEDLEEEEGRELGADCDYENQPRESTDDEYDEEAQAWLQAQPSGTLTPHTLPRHRYALDERAGLEKRTESWHCLPQVMDSSQTVTTPQTKFNVREEETEVTDCPSLEEGVLTQSENHVKDSNRDLLCSPLLVIQDNFASPDLPLLTCLKQDQEFGPDSFFQRSELDFAPLRGIPGKSEDTEWFSRPSEVSEALFQAASKVASDLVNSCFSVSQHPHTGSTTVESQCSFLPPEQGTKETITSQTADELKTPKDSESYDALCSYMSWKTQEVVREPETSLADKDQASISTSTDISDEYITPKGNSSDTVDNNKIPKGNDSFSDPFSYMQWNKQGASHYPEVPHCPIVKESTSDSLVSQDLNQHTFEEVTDSSNCILEGLQGKAESDICTLDDDIESCSLDENAVVCSDRVAEVQREICDQGDLTNESIELVGFKNVLDRDIGESSLHWKSLKLPSKEESSFEESVDHSNVDIKQPFSSILPSLVTHEPIRKLNYHPADLRMLRISPDTMSKTFKHLTAWNLKFNLAHEYECGYSISELNEDDRRKVEEIKAKLFHHEGTTALSKGLQSPQGIGCKPEALCSHIIIESHEKGCFRTLTAEQQPQLDTHPCIFRSAEPSEMIRGQRSPSSWRSRHINLCKSLDHSKPHFKVWNSLQFQSHSPFENFTADDFKISEGLQMPFHEKMDPWLSELVDPAYMLPPEEIDCHFPSRCSSQLPPPESMKKFTTSITFSSHRHSKCISDSSVFKVGVTEGSQCTGASVGVFNSHFTEEENLSRDLKQKTCSPSSFKIIGHSPDKAVTILAESSRQNQKSPVELSHQEEKPLERSHFKSSHFEPSTHANSSNFKEVHFSDDHTFISMDRPSSTQSVKEKNVTITPDFPSQIFLEQRELFERYKLPLTGHHVGKHSPPPQRQDYVAPNLPCCIFLEKRELSEQSKAPHVDHQMKENELPSPQGQDSVASDTPYSIFLEQRKLFEQSKAPNKDYHIRKHPSPLPQDKDCIVEKKNQHKYKSHISNVINIEPNSNNVVSQSTPNQYTSVTSASTPPSNRKAISCVRITFGPKTPSKLDSGTLDTTFHSLDPAAKTRMNSELNSDPQTISSRSLEPASKLLTSKPIVRGQEFLDFLGPKSSPDLQVVQSPLPESNTQDLKITPFQNSQSVTSRQTQVNISDLEGYSNPEGTPVSADRPSEEIKTPFSAFSGKLSSDAVTQITTESPDKTLLSSEIFITDQDLTQAIPEPKTQKILSKVPIKLASSSSIQQITVSRGTDAQPSLLPYKPSGEMKMYYVPQLKQIPSSMDSKSDTTIESSHSGSNDAIAPDFPAQVLGTRDDDLAVTVNIKHKEGIYSKRPVAKASSSVGQKPFQKDNADAQVQVTTTKDERLLDKNQKEEIHSKWGVTVDAQSEEKESLQKDTTGSSDAAATGSLAQLPDTKTENLPDTKEIKQIEEAHTEMPVTKEAWSENKTSLQIDIAGPGFENTTHSVFRSAKFYFHHPVHLSNDQDFSHESLGRTVFMGHAWKDFFQHHPDNHREQTSLPPPNQDAEKRTTDYTKIESLSINVNLENKDAVHNQTRDYLKLDQKINDPKRDHKIIPEQTTQHTASLNELWNKYQERQRQQKPSEFTDRKELSLVERLDRLAKLLQNPITHTLQAAESTQDDSKEEQDVKEGSGKQQQQKNKLQKKKRYKGLEKCYKTTDLKKNKVFPTRQIGRSNQIKIEQIKFDKYILRRQPGCHYTNNTSSDSRPSEESDLLTDTPTNILSPTTSVDSDILTQTDKEVTYERSSSISTIDTARLIQAFGHERVCLSPRQIKLYSSITDHQRRYLEKRSKNKRALNIGHPQMTSEHTRRKHIQVSNQVISSDSISSPTNSFWSLSSTFCNKQNVQMLNKGVQAGNLEIVNGVKKHTRDVGLTFPTPVSSEAKVEEDSDVASWSEDKIEEKMLLTSYVGDRKSRKNKQRCCEGVSWFVPVENVKSGSKKENLPNKFYGPGIAWFAPITNTKPWREPLREHNWQGQCVDSHRPLAGPGRDPPRPFVRATLQESLWLHRPDFISRSGERIKRLKLIVQERKLQNMLQSEREALFNTVREWQCYRDPMHPLSKRGFLAAQKNRPIGKKEMIQRSKRIYEQLPEVQKKREEEKRRSEYKSYRLRAQLYKKKVTNQLLGRKVPWD
ncbi:PREDICTED: Alstrom syndrome protein 1 [Condylura cristata]|uniref:Alstrom syndrome protein 1 n=1 Tax=Condylura cristata TaxID=143302 RepID=UPI0006437491|nr:PREDICTED: Alstrom syndrome protein 1 [Condylura cristata]